MGIEWSHSGALICLMAGCIYTFKYVKHIQCWLKKAPERPPYWKTLEYAPLMGRYVGRAYGYRMVL